MNGTFPYTSDLELAFGNWSYRRTGGEMVWDVRFVTDREGCVEVGDMLRCDHMTKNPTLTFRFG